MISYIGGDLFSAPKGSILAHACNIQGHWGSGVAKEFKEKFPSAYKEYNEYCRKNDESLVGTSLLIKSSDYDLGGVYWIACLFTRGPGDGPGEIAKNTGSSIRHLNQLLEEENLGDELIHMPMINAGIFNTPWEKTEQFLKVSNNPILVYQL